MQLLRRLAVGHMRILWHTIHPAEAFSGNHLEVDALVAILSVDKMRQFHSIEFLWHHAIEIDESSSHPVRTSLSAMQRQTSSIHTCIGNGKRVAGRPQDIHIVQDQPKS